MTAYYNEHDPRAAAWLRELICRDLIAPGEVDERSIEDVRPDELAGFTQCHFFAGIGVWSWALRRAGWPDDRAVWTGSCPCQPFSAAGKGEGFADERHLWPAWFHLISQCRPRTIYGEQVAGANGNTWLDLVSADLEAIGYAIGAPTLPAAGFGAPHGRHRIFFVAHSPGRGLGISGGAPRGSRHTNERDEISTLGDTAEPRCEGNVASTLWGRRNSRGQDARPTGSGTTGLVGNAIEPRLEGHAGNVDNRNEPGRVGENEAGSTAKAGSTDKLPVTPCPDELNRWHVGDGWDCCVSQEGLRSLREQIATSELADADLLQPCNGELQRGRGVGQSTEDAATEPVADSECARISGRDQRRSRTGGREVAQLENREGSANEPRDRRENVGPTNGFWRNAEWIYCRDGKYRATEPGVAPLVTGAPARVVRLRGYGNAINAIVAEEFIRAYIEVREQ